MMLYREDRQILASLGWVVLGGVGVMVALVVTATLIG